MSYCCRLVTRSCVWGTGDWLKFSLVLRWAIRIQTIYQINLLQCSSFQASSEVHFSVICHLCVWDDSIHFAFICFEHHFKLLHFNHSVLSETNLTERKTHNRLVHCFSALIFSLQFQKLRCFSTADLKCKYNSYWIVQLAKHGEFQWENIPMQMLSRNCLETISIYCVGIWTTDRWLLPNFVTEVNSQHFCWIYFRYFFCIGLCVELNYRFNATIAIIVCPNIVYVCFNSFFSSKIDSFCYTNETIICVSKSHEVQACIRPQWAYPNTNHTKSCGANC